MEHPIDENRVAKAWEIECGKVPNEQSKRIIKVLTDFANEFYEYGRQDALKEARA